MGDTDQVGPDVQVSPGIAVRLAKYKFSPDAANYPGETFTAKRIVVDIATVFSADPDPTVEQLSNRFALDPQQDVFKQLVEDYFNTRALEFLYVTYCRARNPDGSLDFANLPPRVDYDMQGHAVPGGGMRTQIKAKGDDLDPGTSNKKKRYLGFQVDRRAGKIVLPLSQKYESLIKLALDTERNKRILAVLPKFEKLRTNLSDIETKTESLKNVLDFYRNQVRFAAREMSLLSSMDSMLKVLVAHPKNPGDDGSQKQKDLSDLSSRMQALQKQAAQTLFPSPASFDDKRKVDGKTHAQALMDALESKELIEQAKALYENLDLVADRAPGLDERFFDAVKAAFYQLLDSTQVDHVLDAHVVPAMKKYSALLKTDLKQAVARVKAVDADLAQVIETAPPDVPADTSLLTTVVAAATTTTQTVGNIAGPSNLIVAIVSKAAPAYLGRTVSVRPTDLSAVRNADGLLYRFIVGNANLTSEESAMLADGIKFRNLALLKRIPWTEKFMGSNGWTGILALANLLVLWSAIEGDDANTVRKWLNMIGSGIQSSLAVAQICTDVDQLIEQGLLKISEHFGKLLGALAAVCAIWVGILNYQDAKNVNDAWGEFLGLGTVAAGGFSLAGFLCAWIAAEAGAGSALAALGPIGGWLMLIGIVVGVVVGVIGLVISLTTKGSQIVFQAFMDEFSRKDGPYDRWITQQVDPRGAALKAAFDRCMDHSVWSFYDASLSSAAMLRELGFSDDHIIKICNPSNDDEVKHQLWADDEMTRARDKILGEAHATLPTKFPQGATLPTTYYSGGGLKSEKMTIRYNKEDGSLLDPVPSPPPDVLSIQLATSWTEGSSSTSLAKNFKKRK